MSPLGSWLLIAVAVMTIIFAIIAAHEPTRRDREYLARRRRIEERQARAHRHHIEGRS